MNERTAKWPKAWGKSLHGHVPAFIAKTKRNSANHAYSPRAGLDKSRLGVRLYGKLVEDTNLYSILNDNRPRHDLASSRTGNHYTAKYQQQSLTHGTKLEKNLLLNLAGLGILTWSFPLYLMTSNIFFSVILGLLSAYVFVYLPLKFVDPQNRIKGISFLKKSLIVIYFLPLPLVLSAFALLIVQAVFGLPIWGISALFEACAIGGCPSRFNSDILHILPYGPGT